MSPEGRGIIVIPAYNEAGTIERVVREIEAEDLGMDVLVVDDGSRDGMRNLLASLPVIVLSHPVNLGYGAAVQTGFRYAVREGYTHLVMMDADGQHVAGQIPALLDGLSRADIVIGSRLAAGASTYRIPRFRRAGIAFFSFLVRILGGVRIRDVTSGFQAMRREVFTLLSEEYPVDFPDADVIVLLARKRFRILEVPVVVRERTQGVSMYAGAGTALYYLFRTVLASFVVLLRLLRERRRR
ncbi:MAG: glycosyltransferase family 2 protein [Deltaproteobacteria bacterium]